MTFGDKLSILLTRKKLSQKELANMIGKSQPQVSQYINGKIGVPFDIVEAIASALDVEISYFSGENYKNINVELPEVNEAKKEYKSRSTLIDTSILENKLESMRRDIDMLKSKILQE